MYIIYIGLWRVGPSRESVYLNIGVTLALGAHFYSTDVLGNKINIYDRLCASMRKYKLQYT